MAKLMIAGIDIIIKVIIIGKICPVKTICPNDAKSANSRHKIGIISPSHLFFLRERKTCKIANPPIINIKKNVFFKSLTNLFYFSIL